MNPTPSTAAGAAVPTLVFPPKLSFYNDDHSTHKQVLTIYNPFDWALRFKILCTSAKHYIVRPPRGALRPRSSIDVVIRLCEFGSPRKDKFMVQILNEADEVLSTKKIVADVLLGHQHNTPQLERPDRRANESEHRDGTTHLEARRSTNKSQTAASGFKLRMFVFTLLASVLIVSVVIPTNTWLPAMVVKSLTRYFSFSTWQQLLGAFILGMIAMSFLRDM